MFQQKLFKDLPNVLGIVDNILIVGYDTKNRAYDGTLRQVMQIWC